MQEERVAYHERVERQRVRAETVLSKNCNSEALLSTRLRLQTEEGLETLRSRTVCRVEDYDLHEDDTDREDILINLHRGPMWRSGGNCCNRRAQRRWCELSTSGTLVVGNGFCKIALNLTQGDLSKKLRPESTDVSNHAWHVRNENERRWERLEAEPADGKHWSQAFADADRLGVALRDPSNVHCGFVWKLSQRADKALLANGFVFSDWRVRLIMVREDGLTTMFSWKDRAVVVVCELAKEDCIVERLPIVWRAQPGTVIFQICADASSAPKVMATDAVHFAAFSATAESFRVATSVDNNRN